MDLKTLRSQVVRAQSLPADRALQTITQCYFAALGTPRQELSPDFVNVLLDIGLHLHVMGLTPLAESAATLALEIAATQRDPTLLRRALTAVGLLRFEVGDWIESCTLLTRAREVAQQAGDYAGIALTWTNIGMVLKAVQDPLGARHADEQALAAAKRSSGDSTALAAALNNLAFSCRLCGDSRAALSFAKEAVESVSEQTSPFGQLVRVHAHVTVSALLAAQGERELALQHHNQAEQLSSELRSDRTKFACAVNYAEVIGLSGEHDHGLALLETLFKQTQLRIVQADTVLTAMFEVALAARDAVRLAWILKARTRARSADFSDTRALLDACRFSDSERLAARLRAFLRAALATTPVDDVPRLERRQSEVLALSLENGLSEVQAELVGMAALIIPLHVHFPGGRPAELAYVVEALGGADASFIADAIRGAYFVHGKPIPRGAGTVTAACCLAHVLRSPN